jgi:uncharacterized protein
MPDRQPDAAEEIITRDGIRLATDVYLPEVARKNGSWRFGAVVIRLPYGRRGPVATLPSLATYVTDRGWALIAQDVRGKFDSSGGRHAFVHEIVDTYDTLEWITAQSWSDGRTIAAGDSYYGYTAWAAVAGGHPSVRGVMARVTSPSIRSDWMYQQGVFRLGNMAEWAASTWMGSEWDDVTLDWTARSHDALLPTAFAGAANDDLNGWATRPAADEWWGACDLDLRRLARPIVAAHVGGWWDLMRRGQLSTWRTLRAASASSLHLLRMDDVDHVLDPVLRPGSPIIDVMADPVLRAARLPSEVQPLLDVIDLVSAGGPDADLSTQPERLVVPARWKRAFGDWEHGAQWPPPGLAPLTLYLGDASQATQTPEGGSLTMNPSANEAVTWLHDPRSPVRTVEHDLWRPLMCDADHRTNHERDDVATFTTSTINEVTDLTGAVVLRATTRADAPVAHLMVSLCHVWPDGTATEITEGTVLVHSGGVDVEVAVDLGEIAYRLEPGARLRLAIAGSSYPKYVLNPGTDESPWTAMRRVPARQMLRCGNATTLTLFQLRSRGSR